MVERVESTERRELDPFMALPPPDFREEAIETQRPSRLWSKWLSTGLLLIVGVAEPLGIVLSIPSLRALGRLSSSSNAPLVFNQVGGLEFWANDFRFVLRDQDGRVVELSVTNDDLRRIRGPHTRTAAYVVPIGLGAIAGPEFYLAPLRYGLCERGPLARDLGHLGVLDRATIVVSSRNSTSPRSWVLEVACPR